MLECKVRRVRGQGSPAWYGGSNDVKDKVVVELWYYQTGGIEYLGDGSKVDVKQSKWAALVTLLYNGNSWQVEEIYGAPQ